MQWLLNAALNANPIGLIVIALAALAAGIYLAYTRSETFRHIVGDAMDVVTGAVQALDRAFDALLKRRPRRLQLDHRPLEARPLRLRSDRRRRLPDRRRTSTRSKRLPDGAFELHHRRRSSAVIDVDPATCSSWLGKIKIPQVPEHTSARTVHGAGPRRWRRRHRPGSTAAGAAGRSGAGGLTVNVYGAVDPEGPRARSGASLTATTAGRDGRYEPLARHGRARRRLDPARRHPRRPDDPPRPRRYLRRADRDHLPADARWTSTRRSSAPSRSASRSPSPPATAPPRPSRASPAPSPTPASTDDELTVIAAGASPSSAITSSARSTGRPRRWSARVTRIFDRSRATPIGSSSSPIPSSTPQLAARVRRDRRPDDARRLSRLPCADGRRRSSPTARTATSSCRRSAPATLADAVTARPADVAYAPAWLEELPRGNIVTVRYTGDQSETCHRHRRASVALYGERPETIDTTLVYDCRRAPTARNQRLAPRAPTRTGTFPRRRSCAASTSSSARPSSSRRCPPPRPIRALDADPRRLDRRNHRRRRGE